MTISLGIAKERILEMYQKVDTNSKYYGRLLNWYGKGVWNYGIGISNNLVFDTAYLKLVNRVDLEIQLVLNVQILGRLSIYKHNLNLLHTMSTSIMVYYYIGTIVLMNFLNFILYKLQPNGCLTN